MVISKLNLNKIQENINLIGEFLEKLKRLSRLSEDDFLGDERNPAAFGLLLSDIQFKFSQLSFRKSRRPIKKFHHEHIKSGSFPEVVVKGIDSKPYLETLFDAILFKDVVKRYNVRFSQKLYDLALYLITNFCC